MTNPATSVSLIKRTPYEELVERITKQKTEEHKKLIRPAQKIVKKILECSEVLYEEARLPANWALKVEDFDIIWAEQIRQGREYFYIGNQEIWFHNQGISVLCKKKEGIDIIFLENWDFLGHCLDLKGFLRTLKKRAIRYPSNFRELFLALLEKEKTGAACGD